MKDDLKDSKFKKKINDARTKRKSILEGNTKNPKRDLKKLKIYLKGILRGWILDGYSKDIIIRFIDILESDIESL